MEKQTLLATGTLILLAGLALASIGVHKIATNLPLSEERTLQEAQAALWLQEGGPETSFGPSKGGNVEVEIWEYARGMINEVRAAKRAEGVGYLLAGLILVVWGATLIYNSRVTPTT